MSNIGLIIKRITTFVAILFLIGMMLKNMDKTKNPNNQESNIIQSKFDLMFKSAKDKPPSPEQPASSEEKSGSAVQSSSTKEKPADKSNKK